MAEGDCREEGDSSGSTLCRGEIRECGEALDLGGVEGWAEMDGFGETVTLGAGVGFCEDCGAGVEEVIGVVVLRLKFQENMELFASAFSRLEAVTTSPPLNVPRVLLEGIVAVGGWPTGIGS